MRNVVGLYQFIVDAESHQMVTTPRDLKSAIARSFSDSKLGKNVVSVFIWDVIWGEDGTSTVRYRVYDLSWCHGLHEQNRDTQGKQ